MNILWASVYLVITFGITLASYKFFGRIGLLVWICISIILANVQSVKIIEIFGLTTTLGNIAYSNIYLATDILSEKYGKKSANFSVLLGFMAMFAFSGLMALALAFVPGRYDTSQASLTRIFSIVPRITLASLVAYVCSQFLDVFIYDKLKRKFHKMWLSNNGGTLLSQIVDTIIFVTVAYAGTVPFTQLLIMMGTMYLLKVMIALLDTGFLYIANKIEPKEM